MPEIKTQRTKASVAAFLNSIEDPGKRREAKAVHKLMREVSGEKGAMWGVNIVGYGSYRFKYANGQESEWMLTGFSPRKQALSLYIMTGLAKHASLLKQLGKHKAGKSCLYVKRLEDIDLDVLRKLVEESVACKRN